MFGRRVERGQHFHQPYLGCREFVAEILSADGAPPAIPETKDLGLMLWDIAFRTEGNRPLFFEARLEEGILRVPPAPGEEARP
jgi:CRISPR-associated protein Cas5d